MFMNIEGINAHCHHRDAALLTLGLNEYPGYEAAEDQQLMVGLHPWDTSQEEMFECFSTLSDAISDPRVIAMGEVGIDPLHGAPVERQVQLLRYMLHVAQDARMPVMFHIVRRFDILLQLHKELRPTAAWAVHGFRSKPEVAQQLADAGIYMSVGPKFNPDTVRMIPRNLLLLETDDRPDEEIRGVIEAVAEARGVHRSTLAQIARENLRRFLVSGQKSV